MKKSLTLYLFVLFANSAYAQQDYQLNCNNNRLLFPKQTLANDEHLDISADHSEISKNNRYTLSGNVSLNSSQYYLSADEVRIQKSDKTLNAKGRVKFQDAELMLLGEEITIKKIDNVNHTALNQVAFHYPDSKIQGRAQQILSDGTQQILSSASYSLCPLGNTDWQLKAEQITLNSHTNRGVANNVVLEFLGVPIFYAPSYKWILKGKGSGFLAPSFSGYSESANSGGGDYQVKIPYYFNLAPDRDLLLTLNQLSSRGGIIEGKYRQLIFADGLKKGRLEIEAHYLDEDQINREKRWLLDAKIDTALTPKTHLNIELKRVSDKNYFKEITHDNTDDETLNSTLNLTYDNNENQTNISLFAENEQLINYDTLGNSTYTRAPELSISKRFKGVNGDINVSALSTQFQHQDESETTGIRTHLQADYSHTISNNAYSLTPKFNLSTTDYALDNLSNEARSIYSFGLDSKLFLEREMSFFNTPLLQTLTSRVAYNYTPKKDQSTLPNFDSADKNDSYEALFSGKKFTGIDNIAAANDITFGLESDFIDDETGDTYLGLKIAQAFYNEAQTVNEVERKYSDIAISAELSLDNFTFDNAVQHNPQTNQTAQSDSSIAYKISPREFLTLAHHYDGSKKSVELYGAYPLGQNIHVFAGVNQSLTDSIINKETTGVAYESCCWALRMVHFKEHIDGDNYDYVTSLELVLKGLASTSPSLYKRLEADVPNYFANLNEY
jgi:LPS-assembly protein